MKTKTTFSQLYNFPGFRARARFKSGVFQDPGARVVELVRRQKKRFAPDASAHLVAFMIGEFTEFATWTLAATGSTWTSSIGAWNAGDVKP